MRDKRQVTVHRSMRVTSITLCAFRLVFVLIGSLSHATAATRPNILFVISDDQSYPHASVYGTKGIQTPAFDRVAKEGVLFSNAFCASPGCSPCRAALLTGRHTWQIEQAGTHASSFPKKYQVFPDILEQAGYHVGYTGKGWGPGNYKISGRSRNPAGPAWQKKRMKSPPGIASVDYAGNFAEFLEAKPKDAPFSFWMGGHEPHRVYDKEAGVKAGKKLSDALVPSFLPDTPEIRSDILDYYMEIEWFDKHLGRAIDLLDKQGMLENTLILVTADNGMPFPRAKANCYEFGIHAPMAVRWPQRVAAGRVVDDLIGFIDIAPTFLTAAGITPPKAFTGRSFLDVLSSKKAGQVDASRTRAFSARERHSSSRYNNWTYPIRSLRTPDYLYIRNFRPNRWPAGDPAGFQKAAFGYYDIDACPSKSFLIENRNSKQLAQFFHWSVDKRPAEELFDIRKDPGCLVNLALQKKHADITGQLGRELEAYLRKTGDPRVVDADGGEIWETYKRYSRIRSFPKPE